jgi:hypothetical protein
MQTEAKTSGPERSSLSVPTTYPIEWFGLLLLARPEKLEKLRILPAVAAILLSGGEC